MMDEITTIPRNPQTSQKKAAPKIHAEKKITKFRGQFNEAFTPLCVTTCFE
jgi:hypothetical protein